MRRWNFGLGLGIVRRAGIVLSLCAGSSCFGDGWIEYFPMTVIGNISADGRTLVGAINTTPAIWSRGEGLRTLIGPAPFSGGRAWAVSGDGSVVVGRTTNAGGAQLAWRWSQATGFVALPDLPGGTEIGEAVGISEDGTVIVGTGRSDAAHPVRWRAPLYEPEGLGSIDEPGYINGFGTGVSGDGTTAIATSFQTSVVASQAAFWREEVGMIGLGDLPGGPEISFALGVSRDGGVIVGFGREQGQSFREQAFRWEPTTGLLPLGYLVPQPARSTAYAVSADGTIVVGESGVGGVSTAILEAFVWTSPSGMRPLASVLTSEHGIDLRGHVLTRAHTISADGKTIAGLARTPSGASVVYVAHAPPVCPADLDDGSGGGTRDGGVTVEDLLYFIHVFTEGLPVADLDNGTFTGTPDGGVTIEDLLYFLARFAAGC